MTYEYRCTMCNHEWEHPQRITDKPLELCPKCGQQSAQRLASGGLGFRLKGEGWPGKEAARKR
jgi:putative FmdB family regulatory protein